MSYRIEYRLAHKKAGSRMRLPFLTLMFFLLFLLLVSHCWPEGMTEIRSVFQELRASAPVSALNAFAGNLSEGESVTAAFSDFLTVLHHDFR